MSSKNEIYIATERKYKEGRKRAEEKRERVLPPPTVGNSTFHSVSVFHFH
jgi:hypothetical protein